VLRDGCWGDDTVYDVTLERGSTAPSEILAPGTYSIEATAYDRDDEEVAKACKKQKFPAPSGIELYLTSAVCDENPDLLDGGAIRDSGGAGDGDDGDGDGAGDGDGDGGGDGDTVCPPEGCEPDPVCSFASPGDCTCEVFGGKSYLFCPAPSAWDQARTSCREKGGDLLIVENGDENAFIASKLGGVQRWMGANDRGPGAISGEDECDHKCRVDGDEGDWYWVNGPGGGERGSLLCETASEDPVCAPTAGQYVNFAGGEPNNGLGSCIPYLPCAEGEDCGAIHPDGTWLDLACEMTLSFVCESL
jgi:hypothetical protein